MAYITHELKRDSVFDTNGKTHRFYPYPRENKTPQGVSEIARLTSGFGFIVANACAIYGNKQGDLFTPAKA